MRALSVVAAAVCAACSATPTPRGLVRAEELEKFGRDEEAARAYDDAAAIECPRGEQRARWCASALRGAAAARARAGHHAEAAAAYEQIPAQIPSLPEEGAAALVSAAGLYLELGEDERAYALSFQVITFGPNTSAADDALRLVLADGRKRDARQLYGVLRDLYVRVRDTEVADNLLWALEELAREDLDDPATALEACDLLLAAHPKSPLADDAAWQGAKLARAAGDPEGAARRLRALLATRRKSWIVGSYFTVHLDDAMLELARVQRDDLHRPADAVATLESLPKKYPDSILRDDALWELAATHAAMGHVGPACKALDSLKKYMDSKHLLERAPALARELGCP